MNNKLGIVILNYNGYIDTINCVKSINEQKNIDIEVCVVDNASANNSVQELKEFIKNTNFNYDVTLIENSTNEGFARGNNVGIKFLREKKCNFVFVLNNDTLISNEHALERLMCMYTPGIGLINPACEGFNGEFQEPYRLSNGNMRMDFLQAIALTCWQFFKGVFNLDYSLHKHSVQKFSPENYKYIIQGNAYILTPDFFKNYKQLFPKTFLYFEELYLLWYIQKANLRTVYNEDVIIMHKEAGSARKTTHKYKMKKAYYMFRSIMLGAELLFDSKETIQNKYN